MTLNELKEGRQAVILKIHGRGAFRHRIIELGFVRGQMVQAVRWAPLKDPVTFRILDSEVSLRRAEAAQIDILECTPEEALEFSRLRPVGQPGHHALRGLHGKDSGYTDPQQTSLEKKLDSNSVIEVCMVGNPNTGKTSLYNALSGAFEHVGNYSGVTVDAKTIEFSYKGHSIRLTDLPGTYSFSPYSPEERVVMEYLLSRRPDVIVNVVDASNLERNLYMTTQLIDMDFRAVLALNMYDELKAGGASLDYAQLGKLLGMPVVPTVARDQKGCDELLDKLINVSEDRDDTVRHTHIPYAEEVEAALHKIQDLIWKNPSFNNIYSSRYLAVCLLDGNLEWIEKGGMLNVTEEEKSLAGSLQLALEKSFGEEVDQVLADYRFAFVKGALRECFKGRTDYREAADFESAAAVADAGSADTARFTDMSARRRVTEKIDAVLTHKIWGFPIFLVFMWLMFQATFALGNPLADLIQNGVDWFAALLDEALAPSILRDLLVDGVIQGVGGVLVFLPNILILFLFISFMEATGYMARVAFLMDRLMHTIGLHGKSFIPMLIGFGCNVPAIMATRTIENRKDRLITMLIIPFMSCSARLPVYLLLVGMFFGAKSGTVIFLIYLFGILISILTALLFRHTILRALDSPFVMEMPPYRLPSVKSVWKSIWNRTKQYLKKIGGVILLASIIVWALGYFPQGAQASPPATPAEGAPYGVRASSPASPVPPAEGAQIEQSYLGQIGHLIEPAIKPLGMNWQMGVCLLAGISAKEVVVSTMSVIMEPAEVFTPLSALAFVFFVLLYFPCIGVFSAVAKESGSWKWAFLMAVYTTAVAWLISFAVFQIGSLLTV